MSSARPSTSSSSSAIRLLTNKSNHVNESTLKRVRKLSESSDDDDNEVDDKPNTSKHNAVATKRKRLSSDTSSDSSSNDSKSSADTITLQNVVVPKSSNENTIKDEFVSPAKPNVKPRQISETLSSDEDMKGAGAAGDHDDYYARLLEQELEGLDDDQKTIAPGQASFSAAKHIAVHELLKPSAASSIASSVFSDHDDPKPDDFMYCDECKAWIIDMCVLHDRIIVENPEDTTSTIPVGLHYSADGVVADKSFTKGTLFGPLEAPSAEHASCASRVDVDYLWEVRYYDGRSKYLLNRVDDTESNWLMRVRTDCTPAEQNLIAIQYKGDVYYKSIRDIRAGDELTVARGQGLPLSKEIPFNTLRARVPADCPIACPSCPGHFATAEKLNEHLRGARHVFDPEKLCPRCAFVAVSARALNVHLSKKHGMSDRHFDCSECGKSFGKRHHLQRHLDVFHAPTHKCRSCLNEYRTLSALANHMELRHKISMMNKEFACPVCDERFYGYEQMAAHRLKAHRDGYYDRVKENLRKRQAEQKLTKAAAADVGGNKSSTAKAGVAQLHTIRESADATDVKPEDGGSAGAAGFQCRFCETVYQKPQSRSRHEFKKHKEQADAFALRRQMEERPPETFIHSCSRCSKRFRHLFELNKHMKRHDGQFDYKCSQCDSAYVDQAELRKHIKRVHERVVVI